MSEQHYLWTLSDWQDKKKKFSKYIHILMQDWVCFNVQALKMVKNALLSLTGGLGLSKWPGHKGYK